MRKWREAFSLPRAKSSTSSLDLISSCFLEKGQTVSPLLPRQQPQCVIFSWPYWQGKSPRLKIIFTWFYAPSHCHAITFLLFTVISFNAVFIFSASIFVSAIPLYSFICHWEPTMCYKLGIHIKQTNSCCQGKVVTKNCSLEGHQLIKPLKWKPQSISEEEARGWWCRAVGEGRVGHDKGRRAAGAIGHDRVTTVLQAQWETVRNSRGARRWDCGF